MRKLITILAIASLASLAYCADVVLGKISDLTWTGSGADLVASFAQGWSDPNSYVGLWEMETTNTTQTLDTSGNSNHASNMPSVAAGAAWTIVGTNEYGRVEHGYTFDGVSTSFKCDGESAMRFNASTDDFSVFAWVKIDAGTGAIFLFDKRDAAGDGYYMTFTEGDALFFQMQATTVAGAIAASEGSWHFVGVVVDRTGTAKLYVDDVADNTVSVSGITMATTTPLMIGTRSFSTPAATFDGVMDNFCVFDYAIGTNQIAEMYLKTNPTNNVRQR